MKISKPVVVAGAVGFGVGVLVTSQHYQKPNVNFPETNSDMISNGNSPVKTRAPQGKCFLQTDTVTSTGNPIKTISLLAPTQNDCAEAADLKRQADITTFCNPSTANEDNSRPDVKIRGMLEDGERVKSTVYFQLPGSQKREFINQQTIKCPKK